MIGVHLGDPGKALRKHLRLEPGEGTMISGLYKGLAADKAGLQQYDIIIAVDGASSLMSPSRPSMPRGWIPRT